MKIINFLKSIWGLLFKKIEYDPDIMAAKRKAVEKFCELQKKICKKCWLYYEIPWYDECYYSDEDVNQTYGLLYGDKDPKELIREKNWDIERENMKLQYRYVEGVGFKYDIRLYHDGNLVRSYMVYIDELNDEIDSLENRGYTYWYTTKEVENTRERYERMLKNIIGDGNI